MSVNNNENAEVRRLRIIHQGITLPGTMNGMPQGSITWQGVAYPFDNRAAWDTPTLLIAGSTISTPKVDGVTKYKVYSNGSFIGYIDSNNVWHGEVSE